MDPKTEELLRTLHIIQGLSQDIDDIVHDVASEHPRGRSAKILHLAEEIQRHTARVLPG